MGAELLIASLLRYAQDDLEAARALALKGNRYAAFHYEQAAEKITKAVLTSESVHATRDQQHLLDRLVDLVPDANPVKALLRAAVTLLRPGLDRFDSVISLPRTRDSRT